MADQSLDPKRWLSLKAAVALLGYLPSPSRGQLRLGPFPLRAYGLLIALGVYVAVVVSARRYQRRGGDPGCSPPSPCGRCPPDSSAPVCTT